MPPLPLLPNPRFRLYTGMGSYFPLLGNVLWAKSDNDAVSQLERELEKWLGVSHAVCVPMARVGIQLAIKNLVKPGQNVIMSPYTIADVVNMVIAAGATPKFVDICRQSCNIDPEQIDQHIDRNTGAVLVTHLHGLVADMDAIREICAMRRIALIEDAAQAFGAAVGGKRCGTLGDAGVYSFGTYKNVNGWYGGAVISDNRQLVDRIRAQIAEWPLPKPKFLLKRITKGLATDLATSPPLFQLLTFWIFRFGILHDVRTISRWVETELDLSLREALPDAYRHRLTPAQAQLVASQLTKVDRDSRRRIAYAARYEAGLAGCPELLLPPTPEGLRHIYTYYPVQSPARQALIRHLLSANRDVGPQHLKNCADLPAFKRYQRDCPVARRAADEVLLLPTYPRYGERQVEKTIEAVLEYANSL